MNNEELMLKENFQLGPKVEAKANIQPLNYQAALASYSPEDQHAITELAARIDVTEIDKIMSYGSSPLISTFEQCGNLLKEEQGSEADQRVIREVIELSNIANKSYDDFNLVLKEPNFLERILLKISTGRKKKRNQRIRESAVTNYKLLKQLKESCDSWIEMLKTAMYQITSSSVDDRMTIELLEKYLVAGYLASERISKLLDEKKAAYEASGLQKDQQEYDAIKDGYEVFQIVLTNLEKSRAMYKLSIGQLALTERGNRNMQITIHTQKNNSMALISQQLRNAVLDAKNREVLEGQQAIIRLNDELMKKVSQNAKLTAEETEKLIYAGFYGMSAAKEAILTVIDGCKEIEKVHTEMVPKLRADLDEVNRLVEELEPYIYKVKQQGAGSSASTQTTTYNGNGSLEF
ncbi:MAG: toxic anion resistance protein [Clostridia bacterium]|nr:toxic anion resistance protein [Clostridia bacterium]